MTMKQVRFSPMVASVWTAVETLPRDMQFSVEDLMRLCPEVVPARSQNPARSLGKCMTHLINHGRVKVAGRVRASAGPKACNLYQRTPAKCWCVPKSASARKVNTEAPEPQSPVTKSRMADGTTRVRFGVGWRPAHPEGRNRGLVGYAASINSEYLG